MYGTSKGNIVFRALFQGASALGLVAIVLIWVGIQINLSTERDQSQRAAVQNGANLARTFEEHIVRSIREIDKTLLFLRKTYQLDPAGFDLQQWTANAYHLKDLTLQVAQIGADGFLVATNIGPTKGRMDLSDREHYRVHLGTNDDKLFISKPVLGRATGKWSVQLTRKIFDAEGNFAGVLVASLDPTHLSRYYESVDIGRDGAVTVLGLDGIIRARGGQGRAELLGKTLPNPRLLDLAKFEPAGHYFNDGSLDGTRRLVSYRLTRDYPLIVTVAAAEAEIFAGIDAKARQYHLAGAALTLMVLIAVYFSIRHTLRLDTAHRALERSEAHASEKTRELEATLAHMSQGLMMVDANRQIRVINRRAVELLELPDAVLGGTMDLDDILRHQWGVGEFGDLATEYDEALRETLGRGGFSEGHSIYERTRPNGIVLEVQTMALPDGGWVRTFTDITERKHTEAVLADARDRAEAASRARSAFLAVMSHEIRTPLNGVIGLAGLLMDTSLDADQARYTATLRDSAEHLLEIINDVLDFSKLEADRIDLERITFDPEHILNTTLDILSPRAQDKGLVIAGVVESGVPAHLTGDPGRLRQVLLNLGGNAVKFTEKGHVEIAVRRIGATDPASEVLVEFSVADTGIGIPEDALPELFQEFSQLDGSISRRFGGTGLGLAICRKIIAGMGGEIVVESQQGVGTIFRVRVPMQVADLPDERSSLPVGTTVLAVSTNAFKLDILRRQLADLAGFHGAATIEDGVETVTALTRQDDTGPLLVLLDHADMPDLAGSVARLREAAARPIRLALMAPMTVQPDGNRLETAKLDGCLWEPFGREALLALLARPMEENMRPLPASEGRPGHDTTRRGYRILLAEDNPTNQLVAIALLERMGHRVDACGNGLEAVTAVRRLPYDLVLMDLMMPEMDGLAATRRIRQMDEPVRSVPIIAFTANAMQEDRVAAAAAGVDGFVAKPVKAEKLQAAIESLFAERQHIQHLVQSPDLVPDDQFDRLVLDTFVGEIGEDAALHIMSVFLTDTARRLEHLGTPGIDRLELKREAHAIKSSSATFGLNALSQQAARLEKQALGLSETEINPHLDQLAESLELSRQYLERFARNTQPELMS